MPSNIVVPELGESVVEATVARWLKKEGDRVSVGEPLVELETEKIDLEVGATRSGVLARIERRDGEDVKIGEVLGVIDDTASEPAQTPPRAATPQPPADRAAPVRNQTSLAAVDATDAKTARARATPSARRLAEKHAVDLAGLKGTGDSGRVTRHDVEAHLQTQSTDTGREVATARPEKAAEKAPPSSVPAERSGLEERIRMSRRRQTIARRLVEAQRAAAMLTTFNEIDMTAVMDIRKRHKESFRSRHGVGLGISSFFVKAAVAALQSFPRLNAEIQGDEMVLKRYYDIGVAVGATEGLVVPVLRNADRMTFGEIETAIKDFARRAEEGTFTLEDLRGGTFTITNGGVFGSLLSTPILNPPQVGILGLHKIEDRAVPFNGQIALRPMMYVALSYDHRLVDGLEAVQFLVRIKEGIEQPASMLLG